MTLFSVAPKGLPSLKASITEGSLLLTFSILTVLRDESIDDVPIS